MNNRSALQYRRINRIAIFVIAVVVLPLVFAVPGQAAGLCGTPITASLKLTADLFCETGGLDVGASNIVIDLGGHTLSGYGMYAILIAGFDGVTVKNGTISGFGEGVWIASTYDDAAIGNKVRGVTFKETGGRGVLMDGAVNTRVEANTLTYTDGLTVFGGSGNQIVSNTITYTFRSGITVYSGATKTLVSRNTIIGGGTAYKYEGGCGGGGILVYGGTSGSVIEKNVAKQNCRDGIHVEDSLTKIASNIANNNGLLGIEGTVGVVDGGQNRASGNGNPIQCTFVVCT